MENYAIYYPYTEFLLINMHILDFGQGNSYEYQSVDFFL